jgi:hypothetical protein
MSIAVTNIGTAQNTAGASLTLGSVTVPAGSLIVVGVNEKSSTSNATGISDTAGNFYQFGIAIGNNNNSTTNGYSVFYYCYNSIAMSGGTITYTKGSSGSAVALAAFYATGVTRTSACYDTSFRIGSRALGSAPAVASNGAPKQGGSLVVAILGFNGTSSDTLTQDAGNGTWAAPPNYLANSGGTANIGGAYQIAPPLNQFGNVAWHPTIVGTTGTLGNNPFATSNTSFTVTVTHTSHGRTAFESVTFSGASTFNNVTINGEFTIQTIVDANSYTVLASTPANANGSGGGASVVFTYGRAWSCNLIAFSPELDMAWMENTHRDSNDELLRAMTAPIMVGYQN